MIDTKLLANTLRKKSLEMVFNAKASHIGSALSIADIIAVLYGNVLKFDSQNINDPNRDRFILSKGHACVVVYAALVETGFFPVDDLKTYGEDFSILMNHISHKVPGVEFSTGALGHGLPYSVGKALRAKMRKDNWRVFVLLSDGEMDEGSNWEALMFAAHHQLDNLCIIIDYNKLQSLDTVEKTLNLEPLQDKLDAFGCYTKIVDGHDHKQLHKAFSQRAEGKPTAVIANTIKGKGVSFMEGQVNWHYKNPSLEQLLQAIEELENSYA